MITRSNLLFRDILFIQIIILLFTAFIGVLFFFSINSGNYALVDNPINENIDISNGSTCPYFYYCFHLEATTTPESSNIYITTHIFYSYNYTACINFEYAYAGNLCQVHSDLTIDNYTLYDNGTMMENYIINGKLVNPNPFFNNTGKSDLYYTNTLSKGNDINMHTYIIKGILVVNHQPVETQLTINVHGSKFYFYQQQIINNAYTNINNSFISIVIDILVLNSVIFILICSYFVVKTKLYNKNQKILNSRENNLVTSLNSFESGDTAKIQNVFSNNRKKTCLACEAGCESDDIIYCANCGTKITQM